MQSKPMCATSMTLQYAKPCIANFTGAGRSFFVHNHVKTIYQMAAKLGELVPEARIAVGHGQMKERDLEKVMLDFIRKKVDVLVCTTIIESGLDIPAANTIIINRADKFGWPRYTSFEAGWGGERAGLCLPDHSRRDSHYPGRTEKTPGTARFQRTGAGFKIALNDLQIRGGGTILGSRSPDTLRRLAMSSISNCSKGDQEIEGEDSGGEVIRNGKLIFRCRLPAGRFHSRCRPELLAYKRLTTLADEQSIERSGRGVARPVWGPARCRKTARIDGKDASSAQEAWRRPPGRRR